MVCLASLLVSMFKYPMAPPFPSAQSTVSIKRDQPVALEIADLSFSYPELDLLVNLHAAIRAGVTLVQGGDGRGKTTLLRLLAGDLQPKSGRIKLPAQGLDLTAQPAAYRRAVFWVDPRSTAQDAITAIAYFEQQRRLWPLFDDECLPTLIEGLSLTEFMDKPLYMLSTGSKRKVWLAAAFASKASVALLDDPFAALDKPSIRYVIELFQGIGSQAARAVVISGYGAPDNLRLAGVIDLGD